MSDDTGKVTKNVKFNPARGGYRGGNRKGVPNKATAEFRETIRQLLEDNAANVQVWLQQVADGAGSKPPDPARALDLLSKLAEYAAPKLSRMEHVGDGGGPVRIVAGPDDRSL
ncbi:MAG: hypothetical protein ACK4Y5_06565 [Acetobacteraceae bacterium]|jgi:hypothetical protein